MKIVHDFGGECEDGVNTYLNLEEFADDSEEIVLFYGINCTINKELQEQYKHYPRRILLNLWDPCGLYSPDDVLGQNHFQQHEYFTDVYSICPYTVEWCNQITNSKKWKYVFYPWQPSLAPTDFEKKYDVCFVGGIHSQDHIDALNVLKKFNYRFISQQNFPGVTDYNVSTKEKLQIIAQSKITICFNLLYLTTDQWHFAMNKYKLDGNYAFNFPNKIGDASLVRYTVPQFKSRLHEAAIGKSLILCKEDDWQIIDSYYNRTDFLLTKGIWLEKAIKEILEKPDQASRVVESAYQKVQNYTTKNLIKYIEATL